MSRPTRSAIVKGAAALLAGTALALAVPLAASAHVRISPDQSAPGGYAVITVRMPNESATASTDKLELSIPTAEAFSYAAYTPVPGWTTEVTMTHLATGVKVGDATVTDAVSKITWTAQPGSELGQNQFAQFDIQLGAVPDTGQVKLDAAQYYTDGSVVNWNESGEDSEHPAPVLYVNDAPPTASGDDDHAHAGGSATTTTSTVPTASSTSASTEPDVLARVLGIAGLAVGVVGLVTAVVATRRRSA